MKVCPKCDQTYDDQNLNFCLNDGEMLLETETIDAPPTIMLDSPRQTNENWGNFDDQFSQQNQPNQQMYQAPFATPQGQMQTGGKDQTLAIVAIISGALSVVLSFCCYLGIIIGPIALITGFMAMNNVNKNPDIYDGKTLAIIGMIAGGVGMAISVLMFVIAMLAQFI
jgi:hypothetical protein